MTRVEFHLTPIGRRTRLELVESGFAGLAYPRAVDALRMNVQGWNDQLDNLSRYVGG